MKTIKTIPKYNFYQRYRKDILFNKNLVVSGATSFLAGALTTQVYSIFDSNSISNALFALLFYKDNKSRYVDPLTGKKSSENIKKDIRKLLGAFSISEVIYIITELSFHYILLQLFVQPYQALAITELRAYPKIILRYTIMQQARCTNPR